MRTVEFGYDQYGDTFAVCLDFNKVEEAQDFKKHFSRQDRSYNRQSEFRRKKGPIKFKWQDLTVCAGGRSIDLLSVNSGCRQNTRQKLSSTESYRPHGELKKRAAK
jgi:hypothetical protein